MYPTLSFHCSSSQWQTVCPFAISHTVHCALFKNLFAQRLCVRGRQFLQVAPQASDAAAAERAIEAQELEPVDDRLMITLNNFCMSDETRSHRTRNSKRKRECEQCLLLLVPVRRSCTCSCPRCRSCPCRWRSRGARQRGPSKNLDAIEHVGDVGRVADAESVADVPQSELEELLRVHLVPPGETITATIEKQFQSQPQRSSHHQRALSIKTKKHLLPFLFLPCN